MALETKVILSLLLTGVSKSESLEEAYNVVADAARVEGLKVFPYDEIKKQIKEVRQKKREGEV